MVCTCLRNSHEMVVFKVQLLLLMMIKVSGAQTVSLQLCSPPKKGDPCQMSCTTPDHTEDITFASNGNPRGTCPIILGNPACGANTAQPSATVTTFIIASLSRSTDDGTWTCTYGSAPGITDTQTLTVLTYPSTPSSSNITHTNGMTTSLRVSSEQIIDLTLVMDCTYPPPTVTWNFKECSGGSTLASKTGSVSEDTSASNICGSTEKNYISTTTFSSSDISNSDGQCVRPELEIKVGNFTAYTVEADFTMTVPEETTTVHGTLPVNLGTTETSEEPQNLSTLTIEITPSSSESITSDANTATNSQSVTSDIVLTTRKNLDVDELLLATVVSSVVGGIILIVILAFVLYFLIKKIRVPSRKKNQQAHEMEGFDNKGMTQEIYSNKHRKGRNGLDSNMQGIGNYRPKSLGTSYSTPYVGNGNPVRSRSEVGNEGYVRSSSRMYPSLPYAAYDSKHNDVAAIQTRNMRYNDRYLQHSHF